MYSAQRIGLRSRRKGDGETVAGTAVTVCLAVKATNIGSVANLTNGLMLSDVKRCYAALGDAKHSVV